MAARHLAKAGYKVAVLEARDRTGGRIYTQRAAGFSVPIEVGAEFVHGNLPVTQEVFKEAGISFFAMEGKSYQVKHGELQQSDEFIDNYQELIKKLNKLEEDLTLAAFLEKYFKEEQYTGLRESVTKFAEGYDAANIQQLSAMALRDELQSGGATNSYFPKGGYSQVLDFLANEAQASGCVIHLSLIVQEVRWQAGHVEVLCEQEQSFTASKILITVPLGVLLSEPGSKGHIRFTPALPEKSAALQTLGFGPVIKILLEFKTAFWDNEKNKQQVSQLPELSFLFSDATPAPTWWTHFPEKTPLLTGWISGPLAEKHKDLTEDDIITEALKSLAYIFETDTSFLQGQLIAKQVVNWVTDPFARGAYTYATVASKKARKVLTQPQDNTLFFAGEALYEGEAMGTVEAALASGHEAAQQLLGSVVKER
ncbi:FAD-dependent oxidoreductase [Pontibacter silvestris]|nr:FAD-dependent oxidoreductase [Pontibacter silvestris]